MSEPHVVSEPNRPCGIDRHLEAALLRQRGQNGPLVREVLACLSPESRERLYRVLDGLEQEVASERRKRKQGRWFG
jgi:hypothetical protein